ncbi:MAG TPA: M20/M25/M40 family metallo-hydrolase [Dissulfurispiraceae bacterium]|nr:M20/M25/M40 family metallo-hydrolase [Dissulfurispiraceae bacterium]
MKEPACINRKRLINTFVELIKINSPSFGEKEIGDFLAERLAGIGFSVRFQKYKQSFNLIAKKGTKRSLPLLLSAHMDTIEPTNGITFAVEKDRIKSVGDTVLGADDKSALAQILEALTVLHENRIPHCNIEIVFSSVEERGLFGARNLDFKGLKNRHALVLDSGGRVGNLIVGAPTHITYKMTVTGKSAHAGIEPEQGISAIRVASEIITKIPDGRIDEDTTANVGIIDGGTATNVVPKEVVIRGELRSHNGKILDKTWRMIFKAAHATARKHKARVAISQDVEYNAFRISKSDPFLRFMKGVFTDCGIEPRLARTGGGSDANIFHQHGIMAINISNGMQKVHSPEEFILLEDLYKGCEVVLRAVMEFERFREKK